MTGPLEGVRVVELGAWVAGPGAGGILADWGADVVKVEPPEGDPARNFGRMLGGDLPVNPVFELDNRGKRGVVLDLSEERGLDLVHQLVAEADVFLTNLRPAALRRVSLGPDETCGRHKRLVYAIITGYGLDGPEADKGAYDIAAYWARAGIAQSLRPPGGPLPFQRGGMGDHTAAMTCAAMTSAALVERARTGRGQLVSTSLLRQGVYTIGFDVNVALMWGRTLGIGTRETMHSPVLNNYTASDGQRVLDRRARRRPTLAGSGPSGGTLRVDYRSTIRGREKPSHPCGRAHRVARRDLSRRAPLRTGRRPSAGSPSFSGVR